MPERVDFVAVVDVFVFVRLEAPPVFLVNLVDALDCLLTVVFFFTGFRFPMFFVFERVDLGASDRGFFTAAFAGGFFDADFFATFFFDADPFADCPELLLLAVLAFAVVFLAEVFLTDGFFVTPVFTADFLRAGRFVACPTLLFVPFLAAGCVRDVLAARPFVSVLCFAAPFFTARFLAAPFFTVPFDWALPFE